MVDGLGWWMVDWGGVARVNHGFGVGVGVGSGREATGCPIWDRVVVGGCMCGWCEVGDGSWELGWLGLASGLRLLGWVLRRMARGRGVVKSERREVR